MRNELARTVSTVAIWAAISAILITLRIRGPEHVVTNVMLGMCGSLSLAATLATFAVWRSPHAIEPAKYANREL